MRFRSRPTECAAPRCSSIRRRSASIRRSWRARPWRTPLADAGAAAMLIPSDKPGRMVYTSAFGFYPEGAAAGHLGREAGRAAPAAAAREGPGEALARRAQHVRHEPVPRAQRDRGPAGARTPSEVVLIGAHYDSWDPAEGADDDGSGVAAVLEAARILKTLGVTPKRTIRFAFFSGEEEATLGSRAYVVAHEKELDCAQGRPGHGLGRAGAEGRRAPRAGGPRSRR